MKVFIGTEAAEGMGHVAPWAVFVQGVMERGWEIHVAAPSVGQVQTLLGYDVRVRIWQAPVLKALAHGRMPAPRSWPELLLSLGYADGAQMTGVVKAWVSILKGAGATVVLADYAPGLILASQAMGVPCLEVGGGFCVPPLAPMPQTFPGARDSVGASVGAAAQKLTASFDEALRACGHRSGLANLGEMESWPVRRIVTSTPQMDHYGQRPSVSYSGFLSGSSGSLLGEGMTSIEQMWPTDLDGDAGQSPRIRVVGYLKADTPGLETLINQLCLADVQACLAIPDAPSQFLKGGARVTVINHPIDLQKGLAMADVYLSNGGLHGLGLAMESGCWPIVVPMQAEQVAMARNLVMRQWGSIWLPEGEHRPATDVAVLLRFRSPIAKSNFDMPSAEQCIFETLNQIADVNRN